LPLDDDYFDDYAAAFRCFADATLPWFAAAAILMFRRYAADYAIFIATCR